MPTPKRSAPPQYISDGCVERLLEHKYSVEGKSVSEVFLQPFWNRVVLLFPTWVAPNLITFIGLLVNLSSCTALIWYNPTMDDQYSVPRLAYFACGVGIIFYQTLDAIDGKQARRTGSSSPLGELFDHGCDAVSTIFVTLAVLTSLQLGCGPISMWTTVVACIIFYVAHWECYVKGSLVVGKIDVSEAQFMMFFVHTLTAIFGPSMWTYDGLGIELKYIMVIASNFTAVVTIFQKIGSILEGGPGEAGTSMAETSILSPLLPVALLLGGIYYMQLFTVCQEHMSLFLLGAGFAFAKLDNKLILGHMSKSALEQTDNLHWGPFVFFVNEYLGLGIAPIVTMYCCILLWVISHAVYSFNICSEIADGLNIRVFTITPVIAQDNKEPPKSQ